MKEKVTTLEKVSFLSPGRKKGNSTRLVDAAIQIIFNGDTCVVLDHHELGENSMANRYLCRLILDRLAREHRSPQVNISYFDRPEITLRQTNN